MPAPYKEFDTADNLDWLAKNWLATVDLTFNTLNGTLDDAICYIIRKNSQVDTKPKIVNGSPPKNLTVKHGDLYLFLTKVIVWFFAETNTCYYIERKTR